MTNAFERAAIVSVRRLAAFHCDAWEQGLPHESHLSFESNLPEFSSQLDRRFTALLGVDPRLSEPIQGQRYDPGEYFKEHTDWFAPYSKEFEEHSAKGGQRNWTMMVYFNASERCGETCFKPLGRCFIPVKGLALA